MPLRLSTHRVIAVIVMGILTGGYRYYDYAKWSQRGRDAFISHQLQRFETYMAHPKPLIFTLISSCIGYAIILGVYELIAAIVSKLVPSSHAGSPVNSR